MSVSEISQKWIDAGYEMFAAAGPKDFKIEKLASTLGLNKSGFYHYFVDREMFYNDLMNYHIKIGAEFAHEVGSLKDFMPGYINTLLKYNTPLKFQIQLRKNFDNPLFRDCYFKVKKRNNQVQIPLWSDYINVKDVQLSTDLFEIAVDLMAIRLESDFITFDYLYGIMAGIKSTVEKLKAIKP